MNDARASMHAASDRQRCRDVARGIPSTCSLLLLLLLLLFLLLCYPLLLLLPFTLAIFYYYESYYEYYYHYCRALGIRFCFGFRVSTGNPSSTFARSCDDSSYNYNCNYIFGNTSSTCARSSDTCRHLIAQPCAQATVR